jgi:serine/threonine protein kinase
LDTQQETVLFRFTVIIGRIRPSDKSTNGGILARTVQGKATTWQMSDTPIGSGDAGEVYAVTCVEQPELTGVMKTPARIATGGTIQRQAGQIAQEARALSRLDGLPRCKANPPRLLDTAPEWTQGTANYFIISETAPGKTLESMLAEKRQTGKPFPRRVIINVLDALFDLFARAHKAGILWNDVKLDHIYWHNPTGGVAVIDWGNAVFLDGDNSRQKRSLPRWEDYQQLVDTLGSFLQQNAPELFEDLGWEEFQDRELDSAQVSVLARRIAYQQEVIALKVMEYQSLIRVVIKSEPTLEGLENIQSYQHILEKIGAPWESEAILTYSRSLVLKTLKRGDTPSSVKAVTILWEIFGQSLDVQWYLVREYFRSTDLLSQPLLHELVKNTLYDYWSNALWTLVFIAQNSPSSDWWNKLIPLLRQKALSLRTPPPYQTCQTLLTWAEEQGGEQQKLAEELRKILGHWREKGNNLEESPFDYALMDVLETTTGLPRRMHTAVRQNLSQGQEAIRELLQAWVNMNWDELTKAFRRVTAWDPDRWGIFHLVNAVEDFQSWINNLHKGPTSNSDSKEFIEKMLLERPPVDRLLGTPPWLDKLLQTLQDIKERNSFLRHKAEMQAWCPWILQAEDQDID